MKYTPMVCLLIALISTNVFAGERYDQCLKEEKKLKAQEAGDCSGMKYLFNPSGCFATRKVLKEYTAGKCREIGKAENVDFSSKPLTSGENPDTTVDTARNGALQKTVVAPGKRNVEDTGKTRLNRDTPQMEITIENLKEENARLKGEINRLKIENEGLKNTRR
jgi:hypothetical protein